MGKLHKVNGYLITPQHPITVSVIGCGGTGSLVIPKLARLNITLKNSGHPGLDVCAYDGDLLTENNIGRQGFYPSDVSRTKASVLIERVNRSFGFNWTNRSEYVSECPSRNITFICVDSLITRKRLYNLTGQKSYPIDPRNQMLYIIDCGNSHHSGQVVIYEPYKSELKSLVELFGDADILEESAPSCSTLVNLGEQGLFINDMISMIAVNTLFELFSSYQIDYNGIMVDIKEMIFPKIPIL